MHKFLIADEEKLFCSGLELILKEQFLRASVFTCHDTKALTIGLEYQENSENQDKQYDLLILDLLLAKRGNFEALKRISKMSSDIPIVIIGRDHGTDIIRSCMNNGANGYILKSSSVKTLNLAINLILSGEVYVPPTPFIEQIPQSSVPPTKRYGQDNPLGNLTRRQFDVLVLMMDGHPNKQIALNLGLLENTVKAHVKSVLKKLNARNRTQAVIIASSLGLSLPHTP